jgi:hypothetical protein
MLATVTISGVTPLLMNRFPDEDPNAKPRSSMIGDKGTPRDQACKKTYETPDGVLYIPGPNIYSGLIEAGKFHKVGKRQVTTLKSSLIPSGIFLLDPECPLFDPQTKEKMTAWEVDSRPVVIPSTGGKVMCHRPRLDVWACSFTLHIEESEFDPKFVRTLVDDLGKKLGLGDFRPQRKGPFGRFVVTSWETEKA